MGQRYVRVAISPVRSTIHMVSAMLFTRLTGYPLTTPPASMDRSPVFVPCKAALQLGRR